MFMSCWYIICRRWKKSKIYKKKRKKKKNSISYNCCRNVRLTIIIGTRVRRTSSTTRQRQIKDKVDYKKEKRRGNPIRFFTSLIHCRGCVRLNVERKSCILFISHTEGLMSVSIYHHSPITGVNIICTSVVYLQPLEVAGDITRLH